MDKKLQKEFANPGMQYRGAPFWAWNGKLEPAELRRQIRIMHRMGLGGFFMHSRVGLDTAYLSKEWFDCVGACVDEAKKLGMNAWLYDEDRWPSGAAGGLVTKNPKYRMRMLTMKVLDSSTGFKWTSNISAAFIARLDGHVARNVRQVPRGKRPPKLAEGENLIAFTVEIHPNSNWYNGYTYLDTLNHEAVKEFIRVTHEAYRKHFGNEFGKTVPGMFTDEPNHGNKLHYDVNTKDPGGLPWTGHLQAVFKKRYGYDIVPHLIELVYDVEGEYMKPARYHYHDCVTHLYVNAFCRQTGEWCVKNKLLFTGHQLEEDNLSSQTNMVGSCMRTYEYMQAPGIDLLTEHWCVFNTAKQMTSAAHQFGWKWRLTETYGCTGWDFPFAGHKALGDWQVAMGINLRCQHLSWYTMSGEAKRDYPAGIFYQSPWWEFYPKVEDYFARVHAVMTRGEEVRDLLVVHPVESMWMLVRNGWRANAETHAFDMAFQKLTNRLLARHLDFDFGDEELMSRHAVITNEGGLPVLRIGKACYKAVVVPFTKTMRRSTLALLRKFKAAGGTVTFVGEIASAIEGVVSGNVRAFAETCPCFPEFNKAAADSLAVARRLSITNPEGGEIGALFYMLREDKDSYYLFVCNTGEDFASVSANQTEHPLVRDRKLAFGDVRIRGFTDCRGIPLELNPETGAVMGATAVKKGSQWEIRTAFPALGSRLFMMPKRASSHIARPVRFNVVRGDKLPDKGWTVGLSECSNLVLDRPQYRIGGGAWQGAAEILRVDRAVREAMGIPARSGGMVQPWARPIAKNPKRTTVDLLYTFDAETIPEGDLFIAVERPETFKIAVNGQVLSMDAECGWWCDLSLRKIPVDPNMVRLGRNEILMTCDYDETHSGLEIVYLLGMFGTAVKGEDGKYY